MRIILAAIIGLFSGLEIGYTWAHGAPESPQTWAVISGILGVMLIGACVSSARQDRRYGP
jgi:hypothetical protein